MAGIKIVSERIKEIRAEMGLNQADFAKLIGVTQQSLSSYEKCISKPTLDVAIRIANTCDISLSWLCGLSDRLSNNKLFRTYTDIIDIFFDIMAIGRLNVYTACSEQPDIYGKVQTMWGISFTDPHINDFLADWHKMRELFINKTIDSEVYDLWREKTIKKYNFPISPELYTDNVTDQQPEDESEKDYTRSAAHELNAAHARTDIEVTEEMKKHDDDIMDEDNF